MTDKIKTSQRNQLLMEDPETGHSIGKSPLSVEINLLQEEGHTSTPLAKIIRQKCLDCCVGQKGEVKKCIVTDCALWPYRMGKNPFTANKRKVTKLINS